jgi:hypothetical protein
MKMFSIYEEINDFVVINNYSGSEYPFSTHAQALEYVFDWFEMTLRAYQKTTDDMLAEISRLRELVEKRQ